MKKTIITLAGAAGALALSAGIAAATPSNNGNFDEPVHSTGPETNIGPDGGTPPLDSQTGGDQPFELNNNAGSFDGFVRDDTDLFGGYNVNIDVQNVTTPGGGLADGQQYNLYMQNGWGEEVSNIGGKTTGEYITPFGDMPIPNPSITTDVPPLVDATEPAATSMTGLTSLLDPLNLIDLPALLASF